MLTTKNPIAVQARGERMIENVRIENGLPLEWWA